jgi:CRP/FNR family transcriptional regulator, cyclic AMP receptor protein
MLRGRPANILLEDRGFTESLGGARLGGASRLARTVTLVLPRGAWPEMIWPAGVRAGAGLLVLDGMLLRQVEVERRTGAELLGPGDLLRPWQGEDPPAPGSSRWRVLSRARMAVLDLAFMQRVAKYPEIQTQLIERSLSRARHLAVGMAIVNHANVETRLRLLLWHLAGRWGTSRPSGVLVPRVTQETLGELIAARRPTVSSALKRMRERGELASSAQGWLLRTASVS